MPVTLSEEQMTTMVDQVLTQILPTVRVLIEQNISLAWAAAYNQGKAEQKAELLEILEE